MDQGKHIFLVEDDPNFGAVLKSYLEINNFRVTWISDGGRAVEAYEEETFDICLLDVMLRDL